MSRGPVDPPLSIAFAAVLSLGISGCLPEVPTLIEGPGDDAGTVGPTPFEPDPQGDAGYELPTADPHALLGVDPPHGPFAGGQRRMVRGHGFSSKVRVFFGANEVPESDVVAIDPSRVQVIVPPGIAGPVDVRAQNADDASTSRVLQGGYVYDAFYAEPATGPTSGGQLVTFHGQGTSFGPSTKVSLGGKACDDVTVLSATKLSCIAPKNTPGRKSATIATGDGVATTVLDAFTYADSEDGFRGGFSGSALASSLKVIALNAYTGDPIPGAVVVAGDTIETALRASTDASGIAFFQDASLGPKRSVTVAAHCHQPMSFVDVPVDTLTAYLAPILSPACASDDSPVVGGRPGYPGRVRGEIVWPLVAEFKRGVWSNVPAPIGNEERTAYIFTTTSHPAEEFRLPDPGFAIRPDAFGAEGFRFDFATPVGNLALYAIAGLEDRTTSPPKFSAYAMGALQGVSTQPGAITTDVFVEMDITLDHAVSLRIASPKPGARGPERLLSTVAIEMGQNGYAILPGMQKTTLLPFSGELDFVGVPALRGALSASRYVFTARAGTGSSLNVPLSVTGSLATNDSSQVARLDDFVELPTLIFPARNESWDGKRLKISFPENSGHLDLIVYDISLGGGLVRWTVSSPGSVHELTLPDLRAISNDLGILPGLVSIRVNAARIRDFDYAQLSWRHLSRGAWTSYAIDDSPAHL